VRMASGPGCGFVIACGFTDVTSWQYLGV
jgi:hypothetical protein